MKRLPKKIGLMDHMGHGNLGDAAIFESFVANISSRVPGCDLLAFSLYPADTQKRHNISAHPITWFYPAWSETGTADPAAPNVKSRIASHLKRLPVLYKLAKPVHDLIQELLFLRISYGIVRSLDLLVLAGGGQLCELYGNLPFNVFKFCLLARLANVPVYMIGVGADLLKRPINRMLARWAVNLCTYVSTRSIESQQLLSDLGVTKHTVVCPDPVYGLDLEGYINSARSEILSLSDAHALRHNSGCPVELSDSRPRREKEGRSRVGLNVIGFCDPRRWPRKDSAAYDHYLEKMAAFTSWLVDQSYEVELFSSDISGDVYAMRDVVDKLPCRVAQVSVRPVLTLKELILQMSTYDYVVTSRFHGIILSHMLAKPVIALSYLPKINHLMRAVGHERYCLELEDFEADGVIGTFQSLVVGQEKLRSLFRKTAGSYAEALRREFDTLFAKEVSQAPVFSPLRPATADDSRHYV